MDRTHEGVQALIDANIHRPAAVFEEMLWTTLGTFRSAGRLGHH